MTNPKYACLAYVLMFSLAACTLPGVGGSNTGAAPTPPARCLRRTLPST